MVGGSLGYLSCPWIVAGGHWCPLSLSLSRASVKPLSSLSPAGKGIAGTKHAPTPTPSSHAHWPQALPSPSQEGHRPLLMRRELEARRPPSTHPPTTLPPPSDSPLALTLSLLFSSLLPPLYLSVFAPPSLDDHHFHYFRYHHHLFVDFIHHNNSNTDNPCPCASDAARELGLPSAAPTTR